MARRAARRSPIRIKKSRQGMTRHATHTPKGKRVPVEKLRQLKRSKDPAVRKRATFALNARSWGKK